MAVRAQWQRLYPQDRGQSKRRVQMRKQVAASRWLITQGRTEPVGINRNQEKIALACEVFFRRLPDLFFSGKMEVSILSIDGRSCKGSGPFGLPPQGFGADFIDDVHEIPTVGLCFRSNSD